MGQCRKKSNSGVSAGIKTNSWISAGIKTSFHGSVQGENQPRGQCRNKNLISRVSAGRKTNQGSVQE